MKKDILWVFLGLLIILFIWKHIEKCSSEQFNSNIDKDNDKKTEEDKKWFNQNVKDQYPFNYDYLTYFPNILGSWTYGYGNVPACPSPSDPSLEGRGLNYDGYGVPKKGCKC